MITKQALETYQIEANKFAVYPNVGTDLAYPALGLVDEAGELSEHLNPVWFRKEAVIAETGDVLWYAAELSRTLGLTWGREIYVSANPPGAGIPGLMEGECILLMAAKIAGRIKKALRDTGGVVQTDSLSRIQSHINVILWECNSLLRRRTETDLATALAENLYKLQSRAKRNCIKGEGDNR